MSEDRDELQALANNLKQRELYNSIEFRVFQHMQICADAYMRLLNSKIFCLTYAEAETAMKEFRLAVNDLSKYLITELNARNISAGDNKNVNARVNPGLDSHWNNAIQYAHRFCFSNTIGDIIETQDELGENIQNIVMQDFKLQNLTAFTHIVADLVYAAEAAKVESYYKELIN